MNFSADVQVPVCSQDQSLQWTFCSLAAVCSSASVPGTVQLSAALQHSATEPNMEISKHAAVCSPGHLTPALTLDTHIHEPLSHHVKVLIGGFNQEKALVGAFSVITNLRFDLHFKL